MEHRSPSDAGDSDQSLPLELQFQLQRVVDQAEQMDEHELRVALLAAWAGWLTERHALRQSIMERFGAEVVVISPGFLPFECCGLEEG